MVLFKIIDIQINVYNSIISTTYNIKEPKALFKKSNFPLTLGSIVFQMFQKYFRYNVLKNSPYIYLSFVKQSTLSPLSGTYARDIEILSKLNSCSSMNHLHQTVKDYKNSEEDFF